MKKVVTVLMASLAIFTPIEEGKISKKERKYAIKYLESSMQGVFKTIKGLSKEQWNYQATPESWSVAGACEHLFIAEQTIGKNVSENIIKNESFRVVIPESERITDQGVIDFIRDRSPSKRVKTPPPFEPKGLFDTPADFIEQYKAARQKNIEFTQTTDAELKSYYFDSPAGKISAYQWLILLSAHAERHTAQMKEVKEDSGFPKK